MLSRLKRPVQAIFLLLALVFITLLLRSQWDELNAHTWRLRPSWLAVSAAAVGISWLFEVIIWRRLLTLMGGRLRFWRAARIYYLGMLARYIPGNVWQPLGMTVLAREEGVRAEATVTSIALFQAINLLTVGAIAAVYFPLSGNLGLLDELLPGLNIWFWLAALPVLVFLLRPQWLMALLNWALRKIGRSPLPVRLSSAELLWALLLTLADWLMLGTGFAALTMALSDFALADLGRLFPHLTPSFPIAYALGYLSFVMPGGLAVREGALVVRLAPLLGGGLATVASLAMRVWIMLGEVVAVGLSLWIGRGQKRVGAEGWRGKSPDRFGGMGDV